MGELEIIFEDQDLLIVNKPAGLSTQAPRAYDSLESRVRSYLSRSAPTETRPYVGIPHRLDRCVSGTIVFAKRKKAAQRLSKQFERRQIRKTYLSMVHGHVKPSSGEWHDHIRKLPEKPRAEIVPPQHAEAKLAVLYYKVVSLDTFEPNHGAPQPASQLKVDLKTGRMHQIRVQCAARGFPVIGDQMYGSDHLIRCEACSQGHEPIALHAHQLQLLHPRTRQEMIFTSPLPESWPGRREL